LIKINEKFDFEMGKIEQIEYAFQGVPDGAVLTLTGWGLLTADGKAPTKLQTLDVNVYNLDQCRTDHFPFSAFVDVGHICTLNRVGEAAW